MALSKNQLAWLIVAIVVIDAITVPPILYFALRSKPGQGEAGISSAQTDALPKLYPVPDFTFTAQDGQPFGLKQLAGKVWVVDVFFTSCAGPCPVMSNNLSELAGMFEPASGARFVSISVDPDTDTPAKLTEYGKHYKQDPAEWTFLNAPIDKVQDLAKNGFKLGAGDSPLIHSEHFVLVDKKGYIRGYFTGTEPGEVMKLKAAMDQLLKEPA